MSPVGDHSKYGPLTSVDFSALIGPDARITVNLPHIYPSTLDDGPINVPFVVRIGFAGSISLHADRAELIRLRDTLTEALDAHDQATADEASS